MTRPLPTAPGGGAKDFRGTAPPEGRPQENPGRTMGDFSSAGILPPDPLDVGSAPVPRVNLADLVRAGLRDLDAPDCACRWCDRLSAAIDAAAAARARRRADPTLKTAVRLAGALADVAHGLDADPRAVVNEIENEMIAGAIVAWK